MPRATWSGSISFGLVNVPVKQVTAVRNHDIRFHLLHDEDGMRLSQQRVCAADGEVVDWKHVDRGFEVSPGEYVKIDPAELEQLAPEASREITITDVVELAQVDPIYFDHTSWLVPATGGERAYSLLVKVLEESGRVAIAHQVQRTREHLVLLRATGGALAISTLHYADEVTTPDNLDLPDTKKYEAKPREVEIAGKLLSALETEFDIDAYHDDWRDQVRDLIERKAQGETFEQPPEADEHADRTPANDIMAMLEASLAAARGGSGSKGSGTTSSGGATPRAQPKAAATARTKTAAKAKAAATAKAASKPRAKARPKLASGAAAKHAKPAHRTAKR